MNVPLPSPTDLELAEVVRAACLRAALGAFEAASISGLCCTGAWECAIGAVRTLDLDAVLAASCDHTDGQPTDEQNTGSP